MDKGSLEVLLGQGLSVAQIGARFGKDPSTVSYWMQKYGLVAVNRDKHAGRGGIERARLEPLVQAGMTIAEIASELQRSKTTVRHWLMRYGLKTVNTRGRRPAARRAKHDGKLTIVLDCRHHGETDFWLEGRGYYRCKRCRAEAVVRRRRLVKEILVSEAGGKCAICGYERSVAALEFHHLDPSQKRRALSAGGVSYALATLREEAAKCILLCSNCHAEVEHGARTVPVK